MEEMIGNAPRGVPLEKENKRESPLSMSNHHRFQRTELSSHFTAADNSGAGKFSGVLPVSRYSQFSSQAAGSPPLELAPPQPLVGAGHVRSRSLSQSSLLSFDALSVFNPSSSAYRADSSSPATSLSTDFISADVSMDDPGAITSRDALQPRKAHRRSNGDIPFAFFQSSLAPVVRVPSLPQQQQRNRLSFMNSFKPPAHGRKPENGWRRGLDGGFGAVEGVTGDDPLNSYMNLDGFDASNSSEVNNGSKTSGVDSSDNEVGSLVNGSDSSGLWVRGNLLLEKKEGRQRVAGAELASMPTPATRNCGSLPMHSFIEKMNFEDDSPQLLSTTGLSSGHASEGKSIYGGLNSCSLRFSNGEFSPAEMKKIMANEKLVDMALSDPKRVKRILANRQSAARSKERKMRYIVELEQKVQVLQSETTRLFAQISLLQRESVSITDQNNELKFRLQAMEQQRHLRDALNETLTGEVQRLKLATNGSGDSCPTDNLNQDRQTDAAEAAISTYPSQPTGETTE